jgi:hypothetical protein
MRALRYDWEVDVSPSDSTAMAYTRNLLVFQNRLFGLFGFVSYFFLEEVDYFGFG